MGDSVKFLRDIYETIDESSNSTIHICEALVTAVRKRDKRVKLTILPDLAEIGWVKLYMINANGNYSSGQIPEVDTTVLVLFPRGQRENAVVLAGGFLEAGETGSDLNNEYDVVFKNKWGNKIELRESKIIVHADTVEISEGATNRLINETFIPLFMSHIHIDPLSGFTGAVDPITTIVLPSHKTDVLRAD